MRQSQLLKFSFQLNRLPNLYYHAGAHDRLCFCAIRLILLKL